MKQTAEEKRLAREALDKEIHDLVSALKQKLSKLPPKLPSFDSVRVGDFKKWNAAACSAIAKQRPKLDELKALRDQAERERYA